MHYVMADIHGNRSVFDKMLSLINLQRDEHLYILGDLIDRGNDGIALLRQIRGMHNVTLLLGNHEYMMINAVRRPDDPECMRVWNNNDCAPTLEAFQNLLPDEREDLLQYLEELPVQLYVTIGGKQYIFVHAAPVELFELGSYKYQDPTKFAVWYRMELHAKMPEGKIVVHGHTPSLRSGLGNDKEIYRGTV